MIPFDTYLKVELAGLADVLKVGLKVKRHGGRLTP